MNRTTPAPRSDAALDDEELADLLAEMSEQDQVRLLAGLGLERSADVVEEMQPDDAADLLAEMPAEQRERLLTAMESVQAADLRRLLLYDATTAGGLMTSQPLIVTPDLPVAEVLHHRPGQALRSLPVHPAQPGLLHPDGLRRAADPAGAEQAGRPGRGHHRTRPRGGRPDAV